MSLFSGAACNVKIPFSITTACDFNQADSDHMTNSTRASRRESMCLKIRFIIHNHFQILLDFKIIS